MPAAAKPWIGPITTREPRFADAPLLLHHCEAPMRFLLLWALGVPFVVLLVLWFVGIL
jgi:hypothetical protein